MSIEFHVPHECLPYDTTVTTLGKYLAVSNPDDPDVYLVPAKYVPSKKPDYIRGEMIKASHRIDTDNFAMINVLIQEKHSLTLAYTKSPTLAYFNSRNDWTIHTG
jgi:hypothetical protein